MRHGCGFYDFAELLENRAGSKSHDNAAAVLWKSDRRGLHGIVLSHVDDLHVWLQVGKVLEFGLIERNSCQYCGKRTFQNLQTGGIEVKKVEYHPAVQPIRIDKGRRHMPGAKLLPSEQRQLRALLGSLQWLAAQCRLDIGFPLSVLHVRFLLFTESLQGRQGDGFDLEAVNEMSKVLEPRLSAMPVVAML